MGRIFKFGNSDWKPEDLRDGDIVILDEPDTTCVYCKRLRNRDYLYPEKLGVCDAFPDGIPEEVFYDYRGKDDLCNGEIGPL